MADRLQCAKIRQVWTVEFSIQGGGIKEANMAKSIPQFKMQPTSKTMPRHLWRFALWPVSVWMSFRQFAQHNADEYVELTSPIMAAAVAFWICVAWIAEVIVSTGSSTDLQVMLFFTPLAYVVGLLLYIN